jgi:glycerophosphoryl diester phosphodiesterase
MSELPPDWERRAREVEAVAIHVNHRHLTPQQAIEVKAAGFGLFCYTVNDRRAPASCWAGAWMPSAPTAST